ncbi:MAG: hypothetical protein GTO40_17895, partial [Deltaproteobacteria bacterium]|nr:hypothetical protein [Deltaproteobacteria bacterium]
MLGLGQCSGGRLLRIERRAINRKRKNKDTKPLRILGDGKQHLTTHLQWKLGNAARRSDNAGDYVCNFSMYVILDYLKRRQMDTRFGFLHV